MSRTDLQVHIHSYKISQYSHGGVCKHVIVEEHASSAQETHAYTTGTTFKHQRAT